MKFVYTIIVICNFIFFHPWIAVDGDTIKTYETKVRLYGVDAPEKNQSYGTEARQYVEEWLLIHDQVEISKVNQDRYGRIVGWVISEGDTLNMDLLRTGNAWHVGYFTKDDPYMQSLEDRARKAKLGLWSQPEHLIENPYQFRKRTK